MAIFDRGRLGSLLRKASLLVLITLIISLIPVPAFDVSPQVASAQPLPPSESRTKYRFTVNLDYENASLTAQELITYTNNTPVDLNSVVFNVTPAHFKAFTLTSATASGKKVTPTLDDVVMEVPLPEILPKGETLNLEIDFRVNVPKRGGRFGVGNSIIALGNWFPIVSVYNTSRLASDGRPIGWSKHKYIEVGDAFFTETADYDVTVNTSTPVTIAHTGVLVGKDNNHWQFQAKGVRDFAMAISNRYQTQSRTVDGVAITAYYIQGNAAMGTQYLDAAALTMSKLNHLVMPYPYPTLDIAEVYAQSSIAQGQEYPNLEFISSSVNDLGGGLDSYLSYIVVHEVTHQWFYNIVGNDQIYQPWLDEAFATWLYYYFLRSEAPDKFPAVWKARLLDLLSASIQKNGDSLVNKGIYDFDDEMHYYNIVYRKGALFIEDLYKVMGDANFFKALQEYTTIFRDRVATPIAFFDIFQSHTSENLNPLIAKYFSYSRYKVTQPLDITVDFPSGPVWSGVVKPKIKATTPISEATVFVEDSVVWTGTNAADLAIDTTTLKNGEEYLLTVKVTSTGRTIERVQRFGVLNEVKKEPTSSSSTPESRGQTTSPSSRETPAAWPLALIAKIGSLGWTGLIGALLLVMGIVYAIRRSR